MKVADLMQRKVVTAQSDEDAEEAWRRMLRKGIRHLVILRDRKIVGVVSDRDMAGARGPGLREGLTVHELMTPGVLVGSSEMSVPEAAAVLRRHRVSSLPIVDDGKLGGILTTTDILDYVIGGGQGGPAKVSPPVRSRGAARKRKARS